MARDAKRDPFDPSRFDFEDPQHSGGRRQVHFGPAVYLRDEPLIPPSTLGSARAASGRHRSGARGPNNGAYVALTCLPSAWPYWFWSGLVVVLVLSVLSVAPPMTSISATVASKCIPERVQLHIEQAIRVALDSAVQRRNFALTQEGARVIPRLTSPNDSLDASTHHGPEKALQKPTAHRPSCWSFPGNRGQIGIRLSQKIVPTHIALDMTYSTPSERKSLEPRQVIVWGVVDGSGNRTMFEHDLLQYREGVAHRGTGPTESLGYTYLVLADYEYDAAGGFPLQTYPIADSVVNAQMVFGVIVVEVMSNWGGERTAICGLRIHGELV